MSKTDKYSRAALDTALERLALLGALSTRASRRKAVTGPKMALGARVAARRFLKTFHSITDAPAPDITITPEGGVTLSWHAPGNEDGPRVVIDPQIVLVVDRDGLCRFLSNGGVQQDSGSGIKPDRDLAVRLNQNLMAKRRPATAINDTLMDVVVF